ncbi:MAG TPA: hypothetical protein DCM10_12305 [Xanthomarina gelatinilytica]|nr:hypothetical protein [Xanthomarina gelatinilytica]|tara:strand:- start:2385 stop:3047 length:663 start_codon:yes stop_codon:yes gene_type:complete
MYKFLLSNGCSFLTQRKGVRKHTGILLSDHLGLEHIGLASSGKGNDRLILTTKLFFYENPERIKDTFVLVGWTNPARIDYIDNYHKEYKGINWGETWFSLNGKEPVWKTYKKIDNYGNLVAKFFRQVLELQDFFENLSIKYYMYHSLQILPYNKKIKLEKLKLLKDKINTNNFYKLDEYSQQAFINSDRDNLVVSKEDLHPNKLGHLSWFDQIKSFANIT